ncbi:MAG: hypothetical protein KM310_03345 [Clostridiales bacterium]|nr:hypothetical protein [Clostridiales bacterium]
MGYLSMSCGTDIHGVCCFGDLLAQAMALRGAAGVVVDGGVRDVAFLKKLPMPIFTRYRTPAQAIGRWRVEGVGEAVALPGGLSPKVIIRPGDWVVGDEDGLLVIPQELAPEVAQRAQEAMSRENEAREAIRKGMPLLKALETFGHL